MEIALCASDVHEDKQLGIFLKNIYLFIWLHWVLVEARGIFIATRGIFSCSMRDLVP